jgi:DUF438 domain-containing protein
VLKGIIKDLHAGSDVDGLKRRFADLIEDVGAAEIGEMEQELIKAGLPQSEITRLCDVHGPVRDTLGGGARCLCRGHPVHTFMAENAAAGRSSACGSWHAGGITDPAELSTQAMRCWLIWTGCWP